MDPKLPLWHPIRIEHRDENLWAREQAACSNNIDHRMCCPCMQCKGIYKTSRKTARQHLLRHGRYPTC
jgi:hypothetical protein